MLLPLATKVEEFKQLGLSNVQVHWGDEHGLDLQVPIQERQIKLTGAPVEFYGKTKLLWAGTILQLLDMDFGRMPEVVPYPLNISDIRRAETTGGWFVWGSEPQVSQLLAKYRR